MLMAMRALTDTAAQKTLAACSRAWAAESPMTSLTDLESVRTALVEVEAAISTANTKAIQTAIVGLAMAIRDSVERCPGGLESFPNLREACCALDATASSSVVNGFWTEMALSPAA
ncbi:MAG TPA: hypothetical protein VMB81_31260 [Candidatus Sulfotelmatobacter sp.]|nr:hypothetical protein [Candidatus Sulfotelmatobacter sp.]